MISTQTDRSGRSASTYEGPSTGYPARVVSGRQVYSVLSISGIRQQLGCLIIPALGGPERRLAQISSPLVPSLNLARTPDSRWLEQRMKTVRGSLTGCI